MSRALEVKPLIVAAIVGAVGYALLRRRVRERVHPLNQYTQVALPSYLEQGAQFDAAFIDGDHSYLACNFDLWHALRLVRPGGVIAAHDYTPAWAGVKQACDENLGHLEQRRLVETLLIVRLPE